MSIPPRDKALCRCALSEAMADPAWSFEIAMAPILAGPRPLDAVMATAEALGALGARLEPGLFETRLGEALSLWDGAGRGAAWGGRFLKEAAKALREALDDHVGGRDAPADSLAYCVSESQDQIHWAAERDRLGLVHDDGLASLAARALWSRGALALAAGLSGKPGSEGIWETHESMLPMAECLARIPGMDEAILPDVASWAARARMPRRDWGSAFVRWPIEPASEVETFYPGWIVAACAEQAQPGRTDFPWNAWLALALPEKATSWGPLLAPGRIGADMDLLRAMAAYGEDDEVWEDGHRADCARAIATLERAELQWTLDSSLAPGGAGPRARL